MIVLEAHGVINNRPTWAMLEVKPKKTKTAVAESEVRDWLALYRRAWESKDVDLLIQLGEVTQDGAPRGH